MAYRRNIDLKKEAIILRDLFGYKFSRIAELHGGVHRHTVRKMYYREKARNPERYADVEQAREALKGLVHSKLEP